MNLGCCICLESFRSGLVGEAEVVSPNCGHLFHRNCLTDWSTRSSSCPHCRGSINSSDVRRIFFTNVDESRRSSNVNGLPAGVTQNPAVELQNKLLELKMEEMKAQHKSEVDMLNKQFEERRTKLQSRLVTKMQENNGLEAKVFKLETELYAAKDKIFLLKVYAHGKATNSKSQSS